MTKNNGRIKKGFSLIEIVVVVVVLAIIGVFVVKKVSSRAGGGGGGGWGGLGSNSVWMENENGWQAKGQVPACPDPLFQLPIDLSLATSVLYPGQYRGGEYKPHGGFRFDKQKTNDITVVAPMDAEVIRGARYPVSGETQYVFDFIAPCGYMYRLGHLLTLSPKFQAIAEKFPMNNEGDSRDTKVRPTVSVKAGETIATAVGMTKGNHDGGVNVFVDFGLYDIRTKNQASRDSAWAAKHSYSIEQTAVCWLDLLPSADQTKVKSLPPSDSQSGKTSDYCQ